mmetsp:Transcript_22693/g.52666  ORF Transcript_22693/g.52666 Transcript_22693/m.52666 type:complete len:222 (-) Transcript_22693:510-1175(-)
MFIFERLYITTVAVAAIAIAIDATKAIGVTGVSFTRMASAFSRPHPRPSLRPGPRPSRHLRLRHGRSLGATYSARASAFLISKGTASAAPRLPIGLLTTRCSRGARRRDRPLTSPAARCRAELLRSPPCRARQANGGHLRGAVPIDTQRDIHLWLRVGRLITIQVVKAGHLADTPPLVTRHGLEPNRERVALAHLGRLTIVPYQACTVLLQLGDLAAVRRP